MSAPAGAEVDWDAAYADLAPRIYNYLRFRMIHPADLEDLTARTFERAWRSRATYRRDLAGFATWLFRIAANVRLDHLRSQPRYLPLAEAEPLAAGESPLEEAEQFSDRVRLERLTADLPERERELLALKYGAGLSNRAIAGLTGLSESNVGTLLHRSVQALRQRW